MNLAPVVQLLRERIGLAPEALGPGALPAVIARRLRALGLADVDGYAQQLRTSPSEWQVLLDEVAVPETWFFRGGVSLFAWLARQARQHGTRRSEGARPFRALSVPCSS